MRRELKSYILILQSYSLRSFVPEGWGHGCSRSSASCVSRRIGCRLQPSAVYRRGRMGFSISDTVLQLLLFILLLRVIVVSEVSDNEHGQQGEAGNSITIHNGIKRAQRYGNAIEGAVR